MWHDRSNALFANYQPKRNKFVCLFSTMHSRPDMNNDSRKQKPNVTLFYNKNRVRVVNCFYQMTRIYATRSASRRWALFVWENIFDIAAIHAKILFVNCTGNRINRGQFTFQLMKNLGNKPESTSTDTSTSAAAVPAAYSDRKRKKCHAKSFNNVATMQLLLYA